MAERARTDGTGHPFVVKGGAWADARAAVLPVLLLISLGAAVLGAFAATSRIAQDSDNVQSFLAARAILHGNPLLSGWHFARDDFFFTDTVPMAGLESLFGAHHVLLAVFPALVYASIVAASLVASLRSLRGSRDGLASLAAIVLLIGLPPSNVYIPLLVADAHGASLLFSLVALMLLASLAQPGRGRGRMATGLAFAALTIAAVASDPFTIVFAFAPASLVLGIAFLAEREAHRMLGLLALLAAAGALGALLPPMIAGLGGFVTEPTISTAFIAPAQLGATLAAFFFGLLYISGADFFGRDLLALGTVASLVRLAGWMIGGVAVLRRVPALCRGGTPTMLDRFLAASIAIVTLASLSSHMFAKSVDGSVFNGGSGTRFLTPILVFGAILAARAMPALLAALPTQRFRHAGLALLLALAGGLLAGHVALSARALHSPPWMERARFAEAGRWLEARGLTCGVGDYWTAPIITALTDGRVTIRTAVAPPKGPLVPLLWASDEHWYRGTELPAFAIWRRTDPGKRPFDPGIIAATYGAPLRVARVAGFTIALLAEHSVAAHPLRLTCAEAGSISLHQRGLHGRGESGW